MDFDSELIDDDIFKIVSLDEQDFPVPALYVVGLPIGNFADITLRALWTLYKCHAIAAEDTRVTGKLLQKFHIAKEIFPLHQHNEQTASQHLLELLNQGKMIALVTDAGTPAISDPGSKAVRKVRENGFRVIPIPGSSAVITALSAIGAAPEGFIFQGFLGDGSQKRCKVLEELCRTQRTFVLYEAPHRMETLANELAKTVPSDRRVWIARELTKKFEEIHEFLSAKEMPLWFKEHPPKGEFVVIVNAQTKKGESSWDEATEKWVENLYDKIPTKMLAEIISNVTNVPKKKAYEKLLEGKDSQPGV